MRLISLTNLRVEPRASSSGTQTAAPRCCSCTRVVREVGIPRVVWEAGIPRVVYTLLPGWCIYQAPPIPGWCIYQVPPIPEVYNGPPIPGVLLILTVLRRKRRFRRVGMGC